MALTASPGFKSSAFTLSFVTEAALVVPAGRRISASLKKPQWEATRFQGVAHWRRRHFP